jgi:hypothetical protein
LQKTIKAIATSAVMMATAALPAFAQNVIDKNKSAENLGNVASLSITGLISGAIRLLVIAAAVVFFFMLVIGGIKWIMSGGDKGKTEEARNQITAALVGLVVVFSAWAIATLIKTLFGVDIFNLEIKALQ